MPATQSVHGAVHTEPVIELRFGQRPALAAIGEHAVDFINGLDRAVVALVVLDVFAHAKGHPAQGRVFSCVHAHLAGGGIKHLHAAIAGLHHRAQAQLGLWLADPALADGESVHFISRQNAAVGCRPTDSAVPARLG